MLRKILLIPSFLALFGAVPLAAQAQEGVIPQCSVEMAGSLSCQANVACECQYFHASAAHGTPAGYRWDCGIKRPKCAVVPAEIGYDGPFPDAVGIDRSTHIVNQSQQGSQTQTTDGTAP